MDGEYAILDDDPGGIEADCEGLTRTSSRPTAQILMSSCDNPARDGLGSWTAVRPEG